MLTIIGAIVLVILGLAFLPALLEGAGIVGGLLVVLLLSAWIPTDDLKILVVSSMVLYGGFQFIGFVARAKAQEKRSRKAAQLRQPPHDE